MEPQLAFNGIEHQAFYEKHKSNDIYHNCLWYLIGVSNITRSHVSDLYDFDNRCIRPEALHAGWQTSATQALTRLAFDLYHGDPVLPKPEMDTECLEKELTLYSISNIFSRLNEWMLYAMNAISLRFM